jgi:hypothetical protein
MASASIPNLSSFSASQLQALLAACQNELLVRITGRISGGSSVGENFQMSLYTPEQLSELINAITFQLNLDTVEIRATPNFNNRDFYTSSNGIPI